MGRRPRRGPGAHARSLDGHPAEPLADLPDARLPALGAGRRSTRPAVRTASAISCRTSWRSLIARPDACARAAAASGSAPVRRRRRAALVAPAIGPRRAHPHLGRPRVAALRRSNATSPSRVTRRCSTRPSRSSRARPLEPGRRTTRTSSPSGRAQAASLYEHCARALDRSLAVGAHGLPLIGSGDWNDGMNRVGHEGRGESVWLGWFLHTTPAAVRADRRGARRHDRARETMAHARERARNGARARRLGRRLVPPRLLRRRHAARLGDRTRSAGSTRSRSRGACCPAPPNPARASAGDGGGRRAPGPARRRRRAAVHAAVRPVRRSIPDTSRATCRASARTAASTRTPRSGRSSRSPSSGDGDKAGELFCDAEPDQPRAHARRASSATRWSRTSWPPTSTPSRRTSGAAAGPGTPVGGLDVPGGPRMDPGVHAPRCRR